MLLQVHNKSNNFLVLVKKIAAECMQLIPPYYIILAENDSRDSSAKH